VLRQKWSRGQVETRLANLPPCLIGMDARVGVHHLSRKLRMLGTGEVLIMMGHLSAATPTYVTALSGAAPQPF